DVTNISPFMSNLDWLKSIMELLMERINMSMEKLRMDKEDDLEYAEKDPSRANHYAPPFKAKENIKIQPYDGDINAEKLYHWLPQLE
ncbi:hypothetical protein KI387_036241, partial [Taxus chinensis]